MTPADNPIILSIAGAFYGLGLILLAISEWANRKATA